MTLEKTEEGLRMEKKAFYDRVRDIFGVEDAAGVSRYCKTHWPEETAHVLRTAEDACENSFLFDYPWDMERTWEPVVFEKEIDWSVIPFGDREFLWQFNRHRFLLCLGQAYLLTGDEKYACHYSRLLQDWIQRVQEGDNIDLGPWRTLETGLRAETWLRSLCMVEESEQITGGLTALAEACLIRHGARLAEHFQAHKYISNWGVLESSGLLLLSIALGGKETQAGRWEETALKRLVHAAKIQVLADGTQWEQSPMYHNEVYQCFRSALYYGEKAGITMPEEIRDAVNRMAYADGIWKKPDHTQFTQGDSDATGLRDQITAGAWVLRDPVLKYWGFPILDYESAWQFGYAACGEYEKMQTAAPGFTSAQLPFSGNYYFRSSWAQDGNLLHFRCGDTGGGHGHADKLHVDLVLNGEDILVDSGRGTYVDGALRYELKEPWAHNVVLVDGKSFSECKDSWTYRSLCSCIKQQYFEGRTGAFVEGSHLVYLEEGILVNRQVIWIKPDIFLLADYFRGTGRHSYESLYHFGRQGELRLMPWGAHFTGERTEAWLQLAAEEEQKENAFREWSGTGEKGRDIKLKIKKTKQSLYYNESDENSTLSVTGEAEGNYRRITVINGGPKGQTEPVAVNILPVRSVVHDRELPRQEALALQLRLGGREYILLLCSCELMTPTDLFQCENCMGYGKAVLFDRSRERLEPISGEVLAWF